MSEADEPDVELGYISPETDRKLLHSAYFPSKIGGRPSWLHLSSLPPPESLLCNVCGKPTIFLMQIYAPIEDEASCFHRTFFLFICRDPACSTTNDARNFHVFRSHLPRKNPFYSFEPPDYDTRKVDVTKLRDASEYQTLCVVCGCIGNKNCSGCRNRNFCSKEHQKVDWTLGRHKGSCGKTPTPEKSVEDGNSIFLFPERQIDTEPEPEDDEDEEENNQVDEEKEMEKIKEFQGDLPDPELEAMATHESTGYKAFSVFKKRISAAPEQILRYSRGGNPLWISDTPLPSVPPCELCHGPRQFEFQIMPQLLSHLNVDEVGKSIDWGVVAIFACSRSCDISLPEEKDANSLVRSAYAPEFIIKQDVAQ